MRQSLQRAFTLVELLVVIAIIGTLVGLLLPAVQSSREAARANQCRIHLTQVHKALQLYENSNESFPGYTNELGFDEGARKNASYVVMLLPFLEQNALWDEWNRFDTPIGPLAQLDVLICPSNPATSDGIARLSYVANAGNIDNEPLDVCEHRVERAGNGMFFDRSRLEPEDQRQKSPRDDSCVELIDPKIKMTFAYVQTGDGTSATLMLSESLRTVAWASPHSTALDRKWHYGFCWGQPHQVQRGMQERSSFQFLRINAQEAPSEYSQLADMAPEDAAPSSHHPGGVNVAFVAGNVKLLNERIDLLTYAQLMTSNRKTSELVKMINDDPVADEDLAQPDDSDY